VQNLGFPSLRCARAVGALLTRAVGLLFGLLAAIELGGAAHAAEVPCTGGAVQPQPLPAGQPDLLVSGICTVEKVADYYYGDVRIIKDGKLIFREPADKDTKVDFWARNILVENGGALIAGDNRPYGAQGNGTLTILLYGTDDSGEDPAAHPGQGVLCHSSDSSGPCGIPKEMWNDNGATLFPGCSDAPPSENSKCIPGLAATESDYFYQYGALYGDGKTSDGRTGYFGYKTLAVSYGGTLVLKGYKGASYRAQTDEDHVNSGGSWLRLGKSLAREEKTLQLDHSPGVGCSGQATDVCGWHAGDTIVVTTTDYLPGHSEELTIDTIDKETITFHPAVKWNHNGTRFAIKERLKKAGATARLEAGGMDPKLIEDGAETRAAVALLTRSIRIVSAGDAADETFKQASEKQANCDKRKDDKGKNVAEPPYCYSFGAHTVFRQGFAKVQIQGVEFENLGQPGKLGHYPVHFHMARKTPADTYVKDSSVNESMTRWYVIHSTLGVTLARNVGYKSIGHGYYFEDGTETDNQLFANIGIFARAAVDHEQQDPNTDNNPRKIPGILADNSDPTNFPFDSDYRAPSVFWITNGWNDFSGNMAAGAGTCGACYWFVAARNGDSPDIPTQANTDRTADGYEHQKWGPKSGNDYRYGYAGLQRDQQGATPLRSFYKNYCSSAMHSFLGFSEASSCLSAGVDPANAPANANRLKAVKSFAPIPGQHRHYYPNADPGALRLAVRCPFVGGRYQCEGVGACSDGNAHCAVTVLDHYTSAFHWAEHNFSAIWMRPQWTLIENSVLSDVQSAGIGIVTGGDYTHSSVIPGFWGLVRGTIFIGHSQPQDAAHAFARDDGPFNNDSRKFDSTAKCATNGGSYCLNKREGISLPLSNYAVGQRFFNIYDGPSYQDSNAFFDIRPTPCAVNDGDCIYGFTTPGLRKYTSGTDKGKCYMPNAAIAWKQPNGFIYPPAFHSTNLFFDNVDIRHYVIEPLLQAPAGVTGSLDFGQGGTYLTDKPRTEAQYCGGIGDKFFEGFTGIDRQTSLNDDDGSLTGLINKAEGAGPAPPKQTISVNEDSFFDAPVKTAECKSNVGVDADKACPKQGKLPDTPTPVTALTSPYDYVTTVIVPGCSMSGERFGRCGDDDTTEPEVCSAKFPNCCKTPGDLTSPNVCDDRFTKMIGRGGDWSSECTNPACYGVPLYRQLLAGNSGKDRNPRTREWARWFDAHCDSNQNTPQCRWPFMRMAGENFYQRNTLTVNHGTYFLDTSVPRAVQYGDPTTKTPGEIFNDVTPCDIADKDHCKPRSVNVFKAGETYYVFFLYAKQSTEQTYQIYVGEGFDTNTVKGVRIGMNVAPVSLAETFATRPPWLSQPAVSGGILTVNVNFNGVSELDPTPDNLCQPKTFCRKDETNGKCVSALVNDGADKDPLLIANADLEKQADSICGTWAVKGLDCPKAGCLGFSFTLPGTFTAAATIAGPTPHRPKPGEFPSEKPEWLTKFDSTATVPDNATGGACFYPRPLPGNAGCEVVE
jgi:hypothetical protein